MGGKSKSVTVGYKHYLGEHMVLCHGPIDNISQIKVDDRIAWGGEETGGQINVQAAELFGGESREGGVSGLVDIEMGGSAQGQNSYLVSMLGSDVPAFRGVVSAVLRQCYLGNNPYLKKWSFRGSRIHVRQNGIEQWYDEKAEIVGIAPNSEPTATYSINLNAVTNAATSPTGGLSVGVAISGLSPTDVLVIRPNLSGPNVAWSPWGRPTPAGGSSGSVYRWTVVRNGDAANFRDMGISGTYNGYEAARAAFMSAYPNGQQLRGASSYEFYIEDTPTGDNSGGLSLTVDVYPGASIDMNPAHIIRECLTDPDWGMGYADSDIDATSFEYAADTLYDEGLGISLLWDRQIKIEDFVMEIVRHIDAALYVDRTTGKFVLKLIRADYDEGTLITLDESNISKVTNPSRATFGELVNSVTVNYWDASTGKDASLTVQDTALVQMQGAVINTTLQYPGFTYATPAAIAAQRDLRVLSAPFLSCTIYTDSTGEDLNIGDTFKFSWARWQIEEMVMRVTGIAFGDGKTGQVRITCSQDVYSTPTTSVVVPGGTTWVDPSAPPTPLSSVIAFEAPYLELVQTLGQADINSTLAGKSDIGYVMGAAARPTSAINGRMWTDSGGGFIDVGGFEFCPYAELDADIGKTDVILDIANFSDLDQVDVGTWCQIDNELMRVDSIDESGGTITVGRGCLDTVPEAHLTGAGIFFWDQFSGYDRTEYVDGEEIDVKLQPVSGAGVVDLASITAETVTVDQRANRPYAPGDLKINGFSYGAGPYSGELAISWVHRDRLQQTSGVIADHFDAGIGPEAGTTYRLQGYIDGVLSHTEDDIAGTSTTWTPSLEGFPVKVEVHAKRDGVYSYQAPWHEFEYGAAPASDPYWDYVAFLMYGEGADGSTTFTDRSRFARTCTSVGGAVVDTDISVGTNPSILLGADARHVRRDHGFELNINSDGPDFCMEAYVYCTDVTQNNQIFGRRRNSDNYIMAIVNNEITFSTFNGTTGTTRLSVSAGMSNNTVHHVAVIRVGTTYYGFVDGVLKGSSTSTTAMGISSTGLYVGESESDQSARFWRGNVNWCRLTIGHKRYDEAGFTPPPLPFATGYPDPVTTPAAGSFANVKLLCGFNGADGSTSFTDESSAAHTATFVGNAQLDTAQAKFGTASLLLDGTGDYVTFPDNADLKIPTAAGALWTLEAWVRATGSWKASATIASKRTGAGSGEFTLGLNSGVPNFFALASGNSCVTLNGQEALALDEWHHIAVSATSGFYRLFANGNLVAFGCRNATPTTNTAAFHVGRDPFNTGRDWAGWIDEVRYTRDEAIYTQSFIPPSSAFPRS